MLSLISLFVTSLVVLFSMFSVAGALPAGVVPPANGAVAFHRRDLYVPTVVTPDADTVWTVGKKASITWDASKVPSNADPLRYLDLYTISPFGKTLFSTRLTSSIDAKTGSITIDVPEAVPGTYFVMLGAWDHSSSPFTIKA